MIAQPQPADCPLCSAAAERVRAAPRGYRYTCPSCGSFHISSVALRCRQDIPASAREDIRRLRAYGYTARIDIDRQHAVRVTPA
ncbi:hypothetical protein LMG26411_00104 [Cupriavidus numazuensis]|uniref:Transposase n=1 Tax=Cupriavidus numazuensis TaxID=221992 RepID=A0ABN7PPS2_9BURK|nr:hypothetical protein LMG26411_00104 [Cupriavidus numazuensis]